MLEVRQEGDDYYITAVERSDAPPEAVYRLLADVRSHLEWGGRRLGNWGQRLLALDAPDGEATVGSEWTSVGQTAGRAWYDRSKVTEARSPWLFEFRTEGRLEDAPNVEPVEGRWVHRYEISPDGSGCLLTYRMKARLTMYSPPGHHSRYPAVVYKIVLPTMLRRGVQSLLRMAEERATVPAPAAGAHRASER